MDTYKLIGYDVVSGTYTNPNNGLVENLPKEGLITSAVPVVGYELYASIDSNELMIDKEFDLYKRRELDGKNAFLRLSAELRLAKLSGAISEQTHAIIEDTLKPVRDEVVLGQWKGGLIILESIGSAIVGLNFYNRIHLKLTDYIAISYAV